MKLKKICLPVKKELSDVEDLLNNTLREVEYKSILTINKHLLDAGGKRLRPAMFLLSAKASQDIDVLKESMINIAAAIELIHMASLIHDDVIDHARIRHKRPTINYKWGQDVSVVLGNYLFSIAFELISQYGNQDIIRCITSAVKTMCEGELVQVCERDNLELLKKQYIIIVKKKTGSLFAASCQAGGLIVNSKRFFETALREYGLNFGMAFQIIDDYLDLMGEKDVLGKMPGEDIKEGDMTLPILNLWESITEDEKNDLKILLAGRRDKESFKKVRTKIANSGAVSKTKNEVLAYLDSARERLKVLSDSPYKKSLMELTNFIMARGFNQKR